MTLALTEGGVHTPGDLMNSQRTVKDAVRLTGIGLHSGKPAQILILPALPNQGITFVRSDIEGSAPIAAHYKNVVSTQLATTLGVNQVTVSTVEHLMAALLGAGVDNAEVQVDGPEIPIMDGSSAPFFEAIQAVGVRVQNQALPKLRLKRKVELKINEKWAVAEPSSRLTIHGSVDWDHPAIGFQEFRYTEGETDFNEFARARTFGFLRDVEALKRMGLARGGSLDNAVVLDDVSVINPDGLRFADEFARHKVLDALGDFKLAGIALQASIRLHRAGHDLHSQLLTAIFSDPENYEIIDSGAREESRIARLRAALAGKVAAASLS